MSAEVKTINIGPAKRAEIDDNIRKAVKEKFGKVHAVASHLDRRYTERASTGKAGWKPYERFLLDNGHTVFVSLSTFNVTVSESVDKKAQAKISARTERLAASAEKKAEREAKKAAAPKVVKAAKAPKAKKAVKKLKAAKVEPKAQVKSRSSWSPEDETRIAAIMVEKGCTRGNAVRQFRNEQAIKSADSAVAPVVTENTELSAAS